MAMLAEDREIYVGCFLEKLCGSQGLIIGYRSPLPLIKQEREACTFLSLHTVALDSGAVGLPESHSAPNVGLLRAYRALSIGLT